MTNPAHVGHLAERLPGLLIDAGWLDATDVVEGSCQVVSVGRRNANYAVITEAAGDTGGAFVKTPRSISDGPGLDRELATLHHLRESGVTGGLPRGFGRLNDSDGRAVGAVFEHVPGDTMLSTFLGARRPGILAARACGTVLADCHRVPLTGRPVTFPLPLVLDEPPFAVIQSFGIGGRSLIATIQHHDALAGGLRGVADSWAVDSVTHADLKWDNVLIAPRGESRRRSGALVVDWELAGDGDRRWDIGSFLAEYVRAWLLSFPIVEMHAPDLLLDKSTFPIGAASRSAHAFLDGYRRKTGNSVEVADVIGFIAARLVQSALEMSAETLRPDGRSLLMLQVAANIFADLPRAAATLFPIDD